MMRDLKFRSTTIAARQSFLKDKLIVDLKAFRLPIVKAVRAARLVPK
jgi:hypothetical protein